MVEIEGIAIETLQRNLKAKRAGKLAQEIFGESFSVYCSSKDLVISEQSTLKPHFLTILTNENSFLLKCKQYFRKTEGLAGKYEEYFNKTKELAEKYEQLFLGDERKVTIEISK